jgi:hypothetical protein
MGVLEFGRTRRVGRVVGEDTAILNSAIEVKTAGQRNLLGRSGTYQFVHASEAAFWPALRSGLGSLLQGVHDVEKTVVFLETTANGYNEFHDFWTNSQFANEDIPEYWQKCFIPWYWDPKYQIRQKSKKFEFLDDTEEELFEHILLDKELELMLRRDGVQITSEIVREKLLWRRSVLSSKFFGDDEEFKQEFPSNESEAFRFSGVSAFTTAAIKRCEEMVKHPIWVGDIFNDGGVMSMEEGVRGKLRVYEQPNHRDGYVIFADVAEGKAVEGITEDKSKYDFSCAQVIKITTEKTKQVAVWHGNCDPDLFGDVLVALAKYFNNAYLGWEINGPGWGLGSQVARQKYRNVYMRKVDSNDIRQNPTTKVGWRTTAKNKAELVSALQRNLREQLLEVQDSGTVSELRVFSRLGENRWGAAVGHDHRVISLGGALVIMEDVLGLFNKRKGRIKKREEMPEEYMPQEEEEAFHDILGTEF